MNKQIRNRTWKYFWEQKIVEIAKFFGWFLFIVSCVFVLLSILYLLGNWGCNMNSECNTTSVADCLLLGMGFLFIISIWALILWGIFYEVLFKEWIVPNWKKAERRAKKDFKRKKK